MTRIFFPFPDPGLQMAETATAGRLFSSFEAAGVLFGYSFCSRAPFYSFLENSFQLECAQFSDLFPLWRAPQRQSTADVSPVRWQSSLFRRVSFPSFLPLPTGPTCIFFFCLVANVTSSLAVSDALVLRNNGLKRLNDCRRGERHRARLAILF